MSAIWFRVTCLLSWNIGRLLGDEVKETRVMMTENTTDCVGDLIMRDAAHVASTAGELFNLKIYNTVRAHFPSGLGVDRECVELVSSPIKSI
jgi:hypothetical protein